MNYNHVFIISPPFYSHFNPLFVLAKSFVKQGKRITFGCSIEFENTVKSADMDFYEINISHNKNTGKAEDTDQPDKEKERLKAFYNATKIGAVETLITQTQHRKLDMLYKPEKLIEEIKKIELVLDIDMYIVDVLSYGVTLALIACDKPFITFCPPHPNTIPSEASIYGMQTNWPLAIKVDPEKLEQLEEIAEKTQKEFSDVFNSILLKYGKDFKIVKNAFSLTSDIGIIYNYLDFDKTKEEINEKPRKIFIGNCFEEQVLNDTWIRKVSHEKKKILITFGTFLSNRVDVIQKVILGCKKHYPEAILYVSAGEHVEELRPFLSEQDTVSDFLPQIAIMPYMDLVIHHGGCNTFTEALFYKKPMIILPFSSDQFNIAYDAKVNGIAEVLDPNHFLEEELFEAINKTQNKFNITLDYWSDISRKRGADYGVKMLIE